LLLYLPKEILFFDKRDIAVSAISRIFLARFAGYSHETARPRFVKRVPRDAFTFLNQAPSLMAKRIEKHDPAEFVNMIRGPDNST